MVPWEVVLDSVITPVLGSIVPVETELALALAAVKPVDACVHRLHLLLGDGVVDHFGGSGVVSFYGGEEGG